MFQASLNISDLAIIISVMLAGALIPGVSVLTVAARSATLGFTHGVLTTLGIVAGDIFYILVAIYGLSLVAELMGQHFVWLLYIGGGYLFFIGLMLLKSGVSQRHGQTSDSKTMVSSFMLGLLITLGDQKAILFYLGFFPAVVDSRAITLLDVIIIILIATLILISTKLAYAYSADRINILTQGKYAQWINRLAGVVLIAVAIVLMSAS